MTKYIMSRVGQTLITIFLVSIITFFLIAVMPKDPVYALYGQEITEEEYAAAVVELGLDKPIITRYLTWLGNVLNGDFGTSYRYHMPVGDVIGQKIGITLYLAVLSTLISFPIGILFGVVTAVKRGKWQDTVLTVLANLIASIPSFVVAVVFLYYFCIKNHYLPSSGFTWPWEDYGKHIKQLIMPLLAMSIGNVANICRQTRSSMLEVIRQDYTRTARAKGLKEKVIIKKHDMRNALIPIVTLIGNRLAFMIGGSMFVESVFSIPGMGSLMIQSITYVDVPIIQACVMLSALCISIAYLVTDIVYVAVDPRISLK